MKNKNGWRLLALLAVVPICGCGDQDADKMARISHKVADKLEDVTGGADGKLGSGLQVMRATFDELGLDTRVSARIRWDKSLAGAQVQVSAKGTTVELKGSVRDMKQRRRAVELAESTTGVEAVTDNLEIAGQ